MNPEKTISIALADDSDPMRYVLKSYLSQQGIETVFECGCGRQLLDYMAKSRALPDVCIVDANMPGLSGYATAKRLLSSYAEVGIIGISFFSERCKERMLENGADICIDKSANPETLIVAIRELAGRQSSRPTT